MIAASLAITVWSFKNRVRVRLRRLREPRYLVGAIAAVAYLYFTIFARMRAARFAPPRRRRQLPQTSAALAALSASGPAFIGVGLLALSAISWVIPGDSGLLDFSEAETDLLFPAPVTRRQLLVHRLIRSQIGLLFASIVPALVVPTVSPFQRVRVAIAIWVLFTALKLFFTGVSLARARLFADDATARRIAWTPFVMTFAALAIVVADLVRAYLANPLVNDDLLFRLSAAVGTGLPHVVLLPFVLVVRPLFAASASGFLLAVAGALLVVAVVLGWVLASDEAFQDAAAEAAARQAARKARLQIGPRARAVAWTLPLTGPAESVFLWKGAMQTVRETNATSILRYGAPLLGIGVALASALMSLLRARGVAALCAALAFAIAAFAVFFGPQMVRTDLRQDLQRLDLLKTWPVRAASIVRGEIWWPGIMLTLAAWVALASTALLGLPALVRVPVPLRLSGSVAAIIVAPALIFAQLTIHNAAAVAFPGWVPLGTQRPRGLDAMGQRLIMFGAVAIGMILMFIPPMTASAIVWYALQPLVGAAALVLSASVCAAGVGLEVLAATEALGPVYERIDLSAVEKGE